MARRPAREEYEHLCRMIKKWNHNRLELFEISIPNENLEFEGIMRFYFQSSTTKEHQKVATKCIRVSNTANTDSVIEALVQKFRPDLRMLANHSSYALYEVHSDEEERRMETDEYPLMVQLGWVNGEREGRFLLRREEENGRGRDGRNMVHKRVTKRGKKVKREREGVVTEDTVEGGRGEIARSLYHVMPESKFTRSISKKNDRNGRFHSTLRDIAEDTLRVYANSILPNGPCKSLLISAHDTSAQVVKGSLEKYGLTEDPSEFCLVVVMIPAGRCSGSSPQLNVDYTDHILRDGDHPLHISTQWKGGTGGGRGEVVQFHLRRKDSFLRQHAHSISHSQSRSQSPDEMDDPSLPALLEMFLDTPQRPRRFLLSGDSTEIGSNPAFAVGNPDPRCHLCLTSASIKPRHCVIKSNSRGGFTITPLDKSAVLFVNSNPVHTSHILEQNSVIRLGEYKLFRFFAPIHPLTTSMSNGTTTWQNSNLNHDNDSSRGDVSRAKSVENIRNTHLIDEIHQVVSSRRLREKAFSEYDLQAQMMVEEEGEREGEMRSNGRKHSDTHTHSTTDEYSTSRKRHPSAPQCFFNPPSDSNSSIGGGGGLLPESDRGEWVTPLSLSFHQTKQPLLLKKMVTEVDPYETKFKLGPAYGLYMVARHLCVTEFQIGSGSSSERKKTVIAGLKNISSHLKRAVKESRSDTGALAFWLANTTELLHFLRQDYQLGSLSNNYDITFTHTIHLVYKYFVTCMIKEIQVFLPAFYDDSNEADNEDVPTGYTSGPETVLNCVGGTEPDVIPSSRSIVSRHSSISGTYYSVTGSKVSRRGRSTIHDVLQTLNSTITLLKKFHVNATLSIMVFSNLFRYISNKVFNRLVGGEVKHCGRSLGQRLSKRLGKVKSWAEKEGMELPAHTHLGMIVEAANLLQASKKHADNAHSIYSTCPHLNSIQVSALLEFCLATDGEPAVNKSLVDNLIHLARGRDEALREEGSEVRVEEDLHPELLFHIPGEGFSGEMVTGIPSNLQEFLQPMINAGLCKLSVVKESSGLWCPPVRNVNSSQSMDHSTSSQNRESPKNFNTLPKTTNRSRKSSEDNEFRHSTLPRQGDHSNPKILKVTISKDTSTLGISIAAANISSNESGIFIRSIMDGGPAHLDGRLRPGDQILEVDGIDLLGSTYDRATQVLRNSGKKVTLLVAKQAAHYYGISHIIQQSSPRYNKSIAPEGSSHAKKAARRLKREQKERQRQERYTTEFRLERKQLDHHEHLSPITQHSSVSTTTDPRFTNPQIAKWIMEQNALYNSEKGGSEVEGPGSTSSMSNLADQDGRASSPVPSFTTSSSRRTKSSYERHSHRTGSPPIRDSSGPPSRLHDGHSTSPFDTLESLEVQTMSDSASKFSDYSAEPEYSVPPPQSAPPVTRMPYKDAFNISSSLCSQQMSNSLTPYSQQQMSSQQGHLDKLSMDVMYHTPQSGASLSGICSIMPRLLQGRGGKPYLGRVHLKELDGDEIDLEKQRIKLMFYEKKNEDRALQEEEEGSPQAHETSPNSSRKVFTSSPPPLSSTKHQFELPTSLEEDSGNVFSDTEAHYPDADATLHELQNLKQIAAEQRRRCKELKYARERESLDLKKAEVEFHEQELMEPDAGGAMSKFTHQERWQKEQKKRLRQLEKFRAEQKEKMQKMEAEEHRAKAKLKAYEASIEDLNQQIESLQTSAIRPSSSAAIVESHLQPYDLSSIPPHTNPERHTSPSFTTSGLQDQMFQPNSDQAMQPEREWPQDTAPGHPKHNTGRFTSLESINSSSLIGESSEQPEFSREIMNTISESTNMTEPTQDDSVIASNWAHKYVGNSDDPYAAEFASKYSYSDDEFFMDNRRMNYEPDIPINAHHHPFAEYEREMERSSYHRDPDSPPLLNGHGSSSYNHRGINSGGVPLADEPLNDETDDIIPPPLQWVDPQQRRKKLPPPPVSEKPQNYMSGRTGHHYSRSNRPRMHKPYMNDNLSTVSGISMSSSHTTNSDFLNGDSFKPPPLSSSSNVPAATISSFSPSSKISSPTSTKHPMHHMTSNHTSYSPYREHPPPISSTPPIQHHLYAVPTSTSSITTGVVYDVPKKPLPKPVTSASTAIYDQPRPTLSSPQTNHVLPATSFSTSPQLPHSSYNGHHDSTNRTSYNTAQSHNLTTLNNYVHNEQHYDVPKPQAPLEQNRSPLMSTDRDIARQTATNVAAHPYQYHGLPTKPLAPRSYSRGRQDGVRGQMTRPIQPQRVQRQQTEL